MQLFTLLISGSAGVGKTLLKHLLLGLKPPGSRSSTSCAECPVKIRSVSLSKFHKNCGKWAEVNTEKLLPMIGSYIRKNVEKLKKEIPDDMKKLLEQLEESMSTTASKNVSSAGADNKSSSTPAMSGASVSLPPDSPLSLNEEAALKEMIDSVFGKLERLISGENLSGEDVEELFSSVWVYFTDSGGQPQFQELLPLFVHDISSLIFVSRLSDRLNDRPPDEFYEEDQLVGKRSCTHLTTTEQLQCITRSMFSRSSLSRAFNIILVGTHLDLAKMCSETIDEKNAQLLAMFGPHLRKHLVFYKPKKELIFPVNCLHPGKDDYEVAKLIQEAVERLPVEQVKVPMWWFILEVLIQALAKKLNKKVLAKRFCLSIANALGFSEKSFEAALDFFNGLNVLKYSRVLPDLVFVDSQVPLHNVSDLVQEGYRLKHGQSSAQMGDCLQICEEGIVTAKFLNDTCKHFEKGIFESPELLKLLESQLAVFPLSQCKYFMPALLDTKEQEDLEKLRVFSSVAQPLLFRFSHGCRRAGVFCCLIVFLMKECGWSIQSEGGELMLVARNCITFWLPKCTCFVTIIDAFYYIEAHIVEPTLTMCLEACPIIREDVLAGINTACEKIKYTNDHPQLAFFCQHPKITSVGAAPPSIVARHAACINKESNRCACVKGPHTFQLQEQHKLWLTEGN